MSGSILDQIANPATVNPLANYKAALDVSSGINQNALFQAKRAQGLAFQNALDPDGSVNQARYLQNLKNDPNAALGSLEAAQGGSTLAGTEQEQMIKRMGIMTGMAAPLLASGQPISKDQWVATLKGGVGSHGFTPAQIDAQAANIPDATPQNPYAVNDWLRGHVTAFINPQQQKLAYGEQGDVTDPQGNKAGYVRNPFTGAISAPPQPGAAQGTSPETRAAETTVYRKMPDGTYQAVREPRSARPGASGATPRAGAGRDYTGEPNPLLGDLPNPSETASPSLAAPPQGQPDQLAAGNKIYNDAAAAVPDQQKRLIAGESALEALEIAKTGPTTGLVAKVKAFSEAQGITMPPQGTMSAIDYRQVLVKNLLRFAQDKAHGAGTDLGLETQLHSNANADEMLPNANRHVLVQDLGILRRDLAQTSSMPKGAAAIDHVKTFSGDIDPRAFATKYMSGDEIGAMVKGMGTKEKEKFLTSLKKAHETGHLDVP